MAANKSKHKAKHNSKTSAGETNENAQQFTD